MKIAIIAHSKYPIAEPFAGGLEKITHQLCVELQELGHHVDLYAHPHSDPALNLQTIEDLKYVPSEKTAHVYGNTFPDNSHLAQTEFYGKVFRKIRDSHYDVVHNHSLSDTAIILGNQLATSFITTFHTPPFPDLQNGVVAIKPQLNQVFTTVSKRAGQIWSDYIDQYRVIYNGIDLSQWTYQSEAPRGVAFWYGRICKEKAPHYAIEACAATGTRLKFAGPVGDYDYFLEKIKPHLDYHEISYLGHLDQSQINYELGRASFSFFTSTWDEPYGLVLAESLACGTPVLGYNSGAAPEVITSECGLLVPNRNVAALKEGIMKMKYFDRKTCRERALNFCSHKLMVKNYLNLYREMCRTTSGLKRITL